MEAQFMIRFTCNSCRTILQTGEEQGGVLVGCPNCKSQMKVPTQVAPPSASVVPTVSNAAESTQTGRPGDPSLSAQPLEVRLREFLARHGRELCGDTRRCESMIRDICGHKTKEAHLLIQALKQQVPDDLAGTAPGKVALPVLARLRQRLEDSLGMANSAARWAVNAWALALGCVTEDDLQHETTREVAPADSDATTDTSSIPAGEKSAPAILLEKLVNQAAHLRILERWDDAIVLGSMIVQKHPESQEGYYARALASNGKGNFTSDKIMFFNAVRDLTTAIEKGGALTASAYFNRGVIGSDDLGQHQEAIADIKQALMFDPGYPGAREALARARRAAGA